MSSLIRRVWYSKNVMILRLRPGGVPPAVPDMQGMAEQAARDPGQVPLFEWLQLERPAPDPPTAAGVAIISILLFDYHSRMNVFIKLIS